MVHTYMSGRILYIKRWHPFVYLQKEFLFDKNSFVFVLFDETVSLYSILLLRNNLIKMTLHDCWFSVGNYRNHTFIDILYLLSLIEINHVKISDSIICNNSIFYIHVVYGLFLSLNNKDVWTIWCYASSHYWHETES